MLSCEEALEQMSQALDGPLTGEGRGSWRPIWLDAPPAARTGRPAGAASGHGELEETPAPRALRTS